VSSNQIDPKSFTDRLVTLAISGLAIAAALYVAVHLLEDVAGVLIGIAALGCLLYLGWLWHVHRQSGW
jgi:hypothetical protein